MKPLSWLIIPVITMGITAIAIPAEAQTQIPDPPGTGTTTPAPGGGTVIPDPPGIGTTSPVSVPEPSSVAPILALGLLGAGFAARKRITQR